MTRTPGKRKRKKAREWFVYRVPDYRGGPHVAMVKTESNKAGYRSDRKWIEVREVVTK